MEYRLAKTVAVSGELQWVDFDNQPTWLFGAGLRVWLD